jgi:hypothetical protein
MAFIWEVEALRKILDTILEGGEAQERYDFGKDLLEKSKKGQAKKSDAAIRDEKIAREQFELGPDDPLPARWEVDSDGLAWDLTPFDHQEEQREEARYPHGRPADDPDDPRNYPWDYKSGDEDAFNKALKAYEDRQAVENIEAENRGRSPTIDSFLDALSNVPSDEAKSRGVSLQKHDQNMGYLRGLGKTRREKDKLKLDWVNEILKEFSDKKRPDPTAGREWWQLPDETAVKKRGEAGSDEWYKNWEKAGLPNWFDIPLDEYEYIPDDVYDEKVPEVLRLPPGKDEKDMSPFLSYMLSQSPYARLPAAGLLGIGSMLYSKPAY